MSPRVSCVCVPSSRLRLRLPTCGSSSRGARSEGCWDGVHGFILFKLRIYFGATATSDLFFRCAAVLQNEDSQPFITTHSCSTSGAQPGVVHIHMEFPPVQPRPTERAGGPFYPLFRSNPPQRGGGYEKPRLGPSPPRSRSGPHQPRLGAPRRERRGDADGRGRPGRPLLLQPPREGGLLRRLGARSRCFCCLDPIPH